MFEENGVKKPIFILSPGFANVYIFCHSDIVVKMYQIPIEANWGKKVIEQFINKKSFFNQKY